MVTAFDRNFDYFVAVKKSRGVLNTNLYWEATRKVLDKTCRIEFHFDADPLLEKRVQELAEKESTLSFQPARARFFQNRPRYRETYIEQAYLQLIDAARRCVSIVLLTNSPTTNDLPEISMVGRGRYKTLLSVNAEPAVGSCNQPAGIQIWEWQGRKNGAGQTDGAMHSKFVVFEREYALVGSFNLDPRSAKLNSESAVVLKSELLAGRLADFILSRDLAFSKSITAAEAQEYEEPRDVIYRFRKSLGEIFEKEL